MLRSAVAQLEEYFAKQRREFDLPLDLSGTTTQFQRDIYEHLIRVEFGHVTSYGQLARDAGAPGMARAVGQAVGANPLPILVPCHRVVGSDRRLTGFSGGLEAKIALLKLEGVGVDGTKPTSKVHPEIIPLDL